MSTVTVSGFVTKIFEKTGTAKTGKPYTLYSVKLVDEHGEEDPFWYQFGFDRPPFESDADTDGNGDYVTFEATPKSDKAMEFKKGTGKIVKNGPKRAKPDAKVPTNKKATTKDSDLFGSIGGYNTEDDVRRMSYSNARDHALKAVALLLEHDGLPITKTQGTAQRAKRFEEITAEIDKLTVEYFFDSASGRKLDSVQDAGTVQVKRDELPDADEFDDELPDEFTVEENETGMADIGETF